MLFLFHDRVSLFQKQPEIYVLTRITGREHPVERAHWQYARLIYYYCIQLPEKTEGVS